jgi:hypothetical protein
VIVDSRPTNEVSSLGRVDEYGTLASTVSGFIVDISIVVVCDESINGQPSMAGRLRNSMRETFCGRGSAGGLRRLDHALVDCPAGYLRSRPELQLLQYIRDMSFNGSKRDIQR